MSVIRRNVSRPVDRTTVTTTSTAVPASVAVAISVHRPYLQYLPAAMASVDAQTVQPTERWVIADGCEPPLDLMHTWTPVSGSWRSPGPGRREVIRRTRCEWVAWLDADDAYAPDYLATLGAAAATAGPTVGVVYPDLAYCDAAMGNPSPRHLDNWDWGMLPRRNYIPTPSLWRVEALRECGGWPCGTPVMDDWRAAMNLRRRGWIGQHEPRATVQVRKHGENNSRRVDVRPLTAWAARRFAIVSLLAGREARLSDWADWLGSASLPPLCDLYVLDDSRSANFRDALLYELAQLQDSGRFGAVVYREAGDRIGSPPVRNPIHQPHARVPWLYNAILPDACRCSDLCLLFEDDVVPPADAFATLAAAFVPNGPTHLAAVTGVYPTRRAPAYVSISSRADRWTGIREADILPGLQLCGGVPGGCTLYDSQALLACLPMRWTYDADGTAVGWDGNTARRLAAAGWRVAYHGDVRCEHHCEPDPKPGA